MRDRALQIVLVLVGLFYVGWIYFLFTALWHSNWLHGVYQEALPMFLSLNVVLGAFLLLAVKSPAEHRSLIGYGAWSSLAHAFVMAIQTVEARRNGIHRSPEDVVIIGLIGVVLLVLLPAKQSTAAAKSGAATAARSPAV
jgi:hypothetical protein